MLLMLCSAAFAGENIDSAAVKDSVAVGNGSVVVDSARYYEDKAIDLKLDGDYLMSSGLGSIIGGSLITAVGGAGVVYGGMFLLGTGLGVLLGLFIVPPTAAIAAAGVSAIADGVSSRSEGRELYRQSEEMYKRSDEFRTKKQQVKVDIVPLINPLTGTTGMNVALRF